MRSADSTHLLCYGEMGTDESAETWKPSLEAAYDEALQIGGPFEIWGNHPETEKWEPLLVSIN